MPKFPQIQLGQFFKWQAIMITEENMHPGTAENGLGLSI